MADKPKELKRKKAHKLTARERLFVAEYLKSYNATRAAIAAGYSEKNAGQMGHLLLKKIEIRRATDKAIQERIERLEFTTDDILREHARIAFADVSDFVHWSKNKAWFVDRKRIPESKRKALKSIKVTRKVIGSTPEDEMPITLESVEFSLHDKQKSLDVLHKHLGGLAPSSGDSATNEGQGNIKEYLNQRLRELSRSPQPAVALAATKALAEHVGDAATEDDARELSDGQLDALLQVSRLLQGGVNPQTLLAALSSLDKPQVGGDSDK